VFEERATRIREAYERRKVTAKRREQRETKAKAKAQLQQAGISWATQLIGYSHSQAQLKRSMEGWVGWRKLDHDMRRLREKELAESAAKLDTLAQVVDGDLWGVDQTAASTPASSPVDAFSDGGLDDEALLQACHVALLHSTAPCGVRARAPSLAATVEATAGLLPRVSTAQPIDV
jgi:hypothetical protein